MQPEAELPLEIATEVADREAVDAVELRPPLYEAIDTDALESLLDSTESDRTSVSFTYCGYLIRVDGSGTVQVTDSRSELESANGADPVESRG